MKENQPNPTEQNDLSYAKLTRRDVLVGALSGLAAGSIGVGIGRTTAENEVSPTKTETVSTSLEQWKDQQESYEKLYGTLEWNQVLFVDSRGKSIQTQELINIQKIVDEKMVDVSPWEEGASLESGSINQVWLDTVREKICHEYGATLPEGSCDTTHNMPRIMSILGPMREVYAVGVGDLKDTEALREIKPKHYIDIVQYFGEKEVIGVEEKTRIQYLREYKPASSELPPKILELLPDLLVGLAAQESKFNNVSLSDVGAKGVFQFMPETWDEVARGKNIERYIDQVEAVYEYFEIIYTRLASEPALTKIRGAFFSDDATFQTTFLLPVMINAYNAGPSRVSDAIEWFFNRYPEKDIFEAKFGPLKDSFDLFTVLAREIVTEEVTEDSLDSYRNDASTYVQRVYALAKLLK